MKLCAIVISWGDDFDMIKSCLDNINRMVDGSILVNSKISNFGEEHGGWTQEHSENRFIAINWEPDLKLQPSENERNKRNFGLQKARELGYTHFLMMDSDEYYEYNAFLKEKERFKNPDLLGLVCGLKCYFKLPTLTVQDHTLVPFIHKLTPDLKFEWNTKYPFAFTGAKREIRIDPTRQMNITSGVEWSDIKMHHMSWVRSDVRKKIRNSTARQNIEKSTIVADYCNAKAGYYCEYYKATIESCENLFNIPEIIDHELEGLQKFSPSGSDTDTKGLH